MKVCSTSPFLAVVVPHTCCTLYLYPEHSRVFRVCYTMSVSHSPQSVHIPTPLVLQCFSSVQSLSVSSSRGVLFIPSLRELQSAVLFMVSIAANSLVQSLLTALHGNYLLVVLVPAYQMTEDYNIRSDKSQLCCFSPVIFWQVVIVSTNILHEITFTA